MFTCLCLIAFLHQGNIDFPTNPIQSSQAKWKVSLFNRGAASLRHPERFQNQKALIDPFQFDLIWLILFKLIWFYWPSSIWIDLIDPFQFDLTLFNYQGMSAWALKTVSSFTVYLLPTNLIIQLITAVFLLTAKLITQLQWTKNTELKISQTSF